MATNIIDPNDINVSPAFTSMGLNGSPDYSDMFIFAELTAQRRTASILDNNGVGKTTLETAQDAIKINMMGFDQDTGKYTTRWTNNTDGSKQTPFEGFGMTSIKFATNSSYIPQVDIEFVDIRGLSLIGLGTKSKYSVLFSFPPPIFSLTLKGYYGKAISYNLHLVKQSTRFDAKSGNYYINVNFVAQRFAPLTDILFKYVDIVPLMKEGITPGGQSSINIDFSYAQPPKNTRELITRARKLYDDIDQFKTDSKEASDLNDVKQNFSNVQLFFSFIKSYNNFVDNTLQANTGLYIVNDQGGLDSDQGANLSTNDSTILRKVQRLTEFDNAIKEFSKNSSNFADFNQRLCILYKYNTKAGLSASIQQSITKTFEKLKTSLTTEQKNVNSQINGNITDITKELKEDTYIGVDLTDMYTKMYQFSVKQQQDYTTKLKNFKNQVNNIAERSIGFVPTIRNIFSVITKDVEKVFSELRTVCKESETEHKKHFNEIVSNNKSNNKFISAFPLILKTKTVTDSPSELNLSTTPTIKRTERAYPGDPELGFAESYFPEIDFVEDFITTFLNVIKSDQIPNLKQSIDADGNNKWLPINPLDSVVNGRLNADSPYKGKFNVNEILNEFINRFYVGSQYSYCFLFYEPDGTLLKDFLKFFGVDIQNKNNHLVEYLAKSEATNLINSVVDANLLNALELQANSWSQNLNGFYQTLQSNVPIYSSLSGQTDADLGTTFMVLNGQKITKNRVSDEYKGFELLYNPPTLRNKSNSGAGDESDGVVNIVEEFIDTVGSNGFLNNIVFDSHGFDDFTKQNIPYLKDQRKEADKYDSDFVGDGFIFGIQSVNHNILSRFVTALGINDTFYLSILTDPNITDDIKAFATVKQICGSLTYYDNDNSVNRKFALSGVIEVPQFAHVNMGAYVHFNNARFPLSDATATAMSYLQNARPKAFAFLFPDNDPATTYINNIANNDADSLNQYFLKFLDDTTENGFTALNNAIVALINEVKTLNITDIELRKTQYERRLEPSSDLQSTQTLKETDFSYILVKYLKQLYLLNYTEITFLPTNDPKTDGTLKLINQFYPLIEINNRSDRNAAINANYFNQFFKEVVRLCQKKKSDLVKLESSFQQSIQDNDIKTQTYYSFKAIADKWVTGLHDSFAYGNQHPLINEFLFVDRFFNDIGDKVVIDFRPIVDLAQDYDVSVFTVLSRILSLNGFEFFPVQNFMNFQQQEWQQSFKTFGSSRELVKSQTPAFVCMYIGGTSSQLDDPLSGYEDDGFKDEQSLNQSPDYNPNTVKGFKVAFAKQNQSMFSAIDLNTNEHKETNESLAILSELAQDQSASSPVPKGQNLYSVYEQRSYTCRVEGFGNVMIQPTQYFLLENVPMFNGAYLILDVEHIIVPNKMQTNFSGVRIRSNPNPLVTEFSTSAGIKAGDSDDVTNGFVNQAGSKVQSGTNRNNSNNNSNGGFGDVSPFPTTPPINNDMTKRLISPNNQ